MLWRDRTPVPRNAERLRIQIEHELDKLAQQAGFSNFLMKLAATLSQSIRDPEIAAEWADTTAENVLLFLMQSFVLRARHGRITLAPRPKTSVSESLKRLARCTDEFWDRVWFELPIDAVHLLQTAEVYTRLQIEPRIGHWLFWMEIPIREVAMPLIEPAIAIAPLLITNGKDSRDAMFGSMLRMWRRRELTTSPSQQPVSEKPRHDEAWRFIERVEACYGSFFQKFDPTSARPRKIFDIPNRRATRENLYQRFVHGDKWPETNLDIDAKIKQRLALHRWLTPERRSPFLPKIALPAKDSGVEKIITSF